MSSIEEGGTLSWCRSTEDLMLVVDLLERAFERTPREHFERHVLHDPTLRPEDTRIFLENGRIVSTVQIFPRIMNIAGVHYAFGGIGNVGTDPRARSRGLAAHVLEDAIRVMCERHYDCSLLWTSINPYYERFGYRTLTREAAIIDSVSCQPDPRVRRFRKDTDFSQIQKLYEAYNKNSIGPVVRDAVYWEGQLRFCGEDPEKFLVLERDGIITAYVRARVHKGHLVILEYGDEGGTQDAFEVLLKGVSRLAPDVPAKVYCSGSEHDRRKIALAHTMVEDTELMILPLSQRFREHAAHRVMGRNAINYWRSDFF